MTDQFSSADCRRLAWLHRECLPDSLVSELEPGYAEAFYRYVTRSPEEKVLAVREGEEIVSGCVLTLQPRSLRRRLLLHTPLLFHAVPWLLRSLFKSKPRPPAGAEEMKGDPAPAGLPELILLFTSPQCRGRGIGSTLLAEWEQFLRGRGYREYVVRTHDDPSNRALRFYASRGFVPLGRSYDHGRFFKVFKKSLMVV